MSANGWIDPIGIPVLDQLQVPFTIPFLQQLFARYSRQRIVEDFE
jgi:hypothetical protein